MSASGTFDYVVTIPPSQGGVLECMARWHEPAADDEDAEHRLVGMTPTLQISDAGLTPAPGPEHPWVQRSAFRLTARPRDRATVRSATFHIDKAIVDRFEAGDVVHMTRSGCGGLGLSVIRDSQLIVAVGAVTTVPLGRSVTSRIPSDLIDEAENVFRRHDPDFELAELPIQVTVGDLTAIFDGGRRTLGGYKAFVQHGFRTGEPGTAECAAIWRSDSCSGDAAIASAQLLRPTNSLVLER